LRDDDEDGSRLRIHNLLSMLFVVVWRERSAHDFALLFKSRGKKEKDKEEEEDVVGEGGGTGGASFGCPSARGVP